jgi:glycosyltransferase involved in cell wall biosynthesis
MRILYTSLGYLPAVSWGGPVRVVHQQAKEMRRRGHEVTIAASNLLNKQQKIEHEQQPIVMDGVPVHYLQTYSLAAWPGSLGPSMISSGAKRQLAALVDWADIVHVHTARNAIAIQSIQLASQAGKPVLVQPHGSLQHIVSSVRLKKIYDRMVLADVLDKVDGVIALQDEERSQTLQAGVPPELIHIIPNGLEPVTAARKGQKGRFRAKLGIPADRQLILFFARINLKKGTDLLVEAYQSIPPAQRANMTLVIAGPDDGQLAEVNRLIEQFGLQDEVILPGLVTGDLIDAAYLDADVFVLPCRADTFPMTVLEACSFGTPIVITETCEISELVRDEAAAVVAVDPAAIAAAILEVLNSESLRRRYQLGGQALIEHTFSIAAVGTMLEDLYAQVQSETAERVPA